MRIFCLLLAKTEVCQQLLVTFPSRYFMNICSGILHMLDMDGKRNMATLKEFLELLAAHAPRK
jgi:hypothetical protein